MFDNIKIAVIGAGAIGGITAAYLSKAGADVELVCKHPETADTANNQGLTIKGVRGEQHIIVKSVTEIEQLSGQKDFILIAVKAYDMPDAARRSLPFLKPDSLVVSMQNGICTDALAAVVGDDRTVGCVVGWGASMLDKGVLEQTSEGEFVIGKIAPGGELQLAKLKSILETVVPTRISPEIASELYSKMIVNSCISSMGVCSGLMLGQMLKLKKARGIFMAVIREAVDVADALGLKLPPFAGKLDYYKMARGKGAFAMLKNHLIIRIVGIKYRRLKSSSLQSLRRGKPTEIDYFNGYIARKGAEAGVKAPFNDTIVRLVKEIEAGKRQPDQANFAEFK